MMSSKVLHLDLTADQKLFFVSDTHFNHQKLVKECPDHFECVRNYSTVDEMNADIIAKWNASVTDDDVVVFLGDFFMNTQVKDVLWRFYDYKQHLNGRIYWVRGNHDGVIKHKVKSHTFYDVADIRKQVVDRFSIRYIAQHHPFGEVPFYLDNQFKLHGKDTQWLDHLVLVHGHTHLTEPHGDLNFATYGHLTENNVCWDAWYKPVPSVDLMFAKPVYVY